MAHDVVITASRTASAVAWHTLIARGDRIVISEFTDCCSKRLSFSGLGIGRAAAAQIASTKMAAKSIQMIAMSQISITGLLFAVSNCPDYFSGAISVSFFSMPLVATELPLLVLQQASVSAPQLVHLWVATDCFALPTPTMFQSVPQPSH